MIRSAGFAAKSAAAFGRGYRFGRAMRRAGPPLSALAEAAAPSPLERYFDAVTEGPGIWKWRHYFDIYHRHFAKFIGQPVRVVEIGVLGGGSLGMWRDYFGDQAHVYGVDIQPECKAYEGPGVEIYIGDQGNPEFWADFRNRAPVVDIVVDDGSHRSGHQIVTLEQLLPHLRGGGVFLVEDIPAEFQPFHSYIDALGRHLHTPTEEPHGLHQHVASIHRYPQLTVIEKPDRPPKRFTSPNHGTFTTTWHLYHHLAPLPPPGTFTTTTNLATSIEPAHNAK